LIGFERAPAEIDLILARIAIEQNLRLPEKNRDWQEVKQLLARAERNLPDSVDVPILHAEVLLLETTRNKDKARSLLQKARDRRPERVELWLGLAALMG